MRERSWKAVALAGILASTTTICLVIFNADYYRQGWIGFFLLVVGVGTFVWNMKEYEKMSQKTGAERREKYQPQREWKMRNAQRIADERRARKVYFGCELDKKRDKDLIDQVRAWNGSKVDFFRAAASALDALSRGGENGEGTEIAER